MGYKVRELTVVSSFHFRLDLFDTKEDLFNFDMLAYILCSLVPTQGCDV